MYKIIPAPGTKWNVWSGFPDIESAIEEMRMYASSVKEDLSVRYESDENGFPTAFLKVCEDILIVRNNESDQLTRRKKFRDRVSSAGCRLMEDEERIHTMMRYEIVRTKDAHSEPVTGEIFARVLGEFEHRRYFMSRESAKIFLAMYAQISYFRIRRCGREDASDSIMMAFAVGIEAMNSGVYDAGESGVYTVEEVRIPEPQSDAEWEKFIESDIEHPDGETRYLRQIISKYREAIGTSEDRVVPDPEEEPDLALEGDFDDMPF